MTPFSDPQTQIHLAKAGDARIWPILHVLVAALVAPAGCNFRPAGETPVTPSAADDDPAPWFTDVSVAAGLRFLHNAGPVGQFFMPETVGSGAALFDYDNDGRLDICLVNSGGPKSGSTHKLLHNAGDGRFADVSAGSGLDVASWGMGIAVGDLTNDGFPDVLITEYGGARLFINQGGDGTFRDVTNAAGIAEQHWTTSAAMFDYDRDGRLDLLIANYIAYSHLQACFDRSGRLDYCGPESAPALAARLYRNLGAPSDGSEPAHFEDVSSSSGIGALAGPALGVVGLDFSGDGWADILVANDGKPNYLWINQRDGTFKEQGAVRGIAFNAQGLAQANMGIAIGDIDGNGLTDVYITHLTEETNVLWQQGPQGMFRDRTAAAGLAASRWRGTGFGTVLADFDQDGDPDLAVVNGRVKRPPLDSAPIGEDDSQDFWNTFKERSQLLANDGTGKFRDVSAANAAFCGTPIVGRGLACGDVNGDGALDLLVTTAGGPAHLYFNVAANRGHWALIRAVDSALGNRDALGSRITIEAGGRQQVGWCAAASSYLSSSDPRAHFGLGRADEIESLEVLWPDGTIERFPGGPADQVRVVSKGTGIPAEKSADKRPAPPDRLSKERQ